MFFEVFSLIYHSPLTIESLTYRVSLRTLLYTSHCRRFLDDLTQFLLSSLFDFGQCVLDRLKTIPRGAWRAPLLAHVRFQGLGLINMQFAPVPHCDRIQRWLLKQSSRQGIENRG